MPQIDELLRKMPQTGASDLMLMVGEKPKFKLHGEVVEIEGYDVLEPDRLREILYEITAPDQAERYQNHWDLDFAYGLEGVGRFRSNYFMQQTGMAAVFRLIPSHIMTLQQLSMPAVLVRLCNIRAGLILVTGPTGSGKTTTLAAMIDHINTHQSRRVITIEEPVEFVHPNKNSLISHREVGTHTETFASALRAVTRQDADVVLVGELRDLETMGLALSAAAMGTLVFGTLHTNSAPKTVDRIIDIFPSDQHSQVRTVLAESLRGIVAQQLLRKKGGKGRVAVTEILVGNQAVASIIREGKIERIISVLQAGKREGMQIMDDVLDALVKEGTIDGRDAYMKANDKSRFEKYVKDDGLPEA